MILVESKRANYVGVDATLCKCIIKSTHGLPCAHEIAECLRDLCPISISNIHPHWLKLNLEKFQPSCDSFEVNIDDEINTIWSRFHAFDEIGKLTMKRKLRDLGNPATTFLTPPLEKCKTKGRPFLKNFESTRRDPSYFEVVEAELSGKSVTFKNPKKLIVRRPNHPMHYLDCFPLYIQPHIRGIFDVKADRHCGFRAIARQLGFGEDHWAKVREDLAEELCHHRSYYAKFYGSVELVAQLLKALSYFIIPTPCEYWMTLPDMGHLVATRYNVVLISISKQQSCTYLPLRSNSPPQPHCKIIAIGFVNDNHFVQVLLDHVASIPPIVPNWSYFRLESAAGLDIPFLDRINDFKALLPIESNYGSGKIVNLDD